VSHELYETLFVRRSRRNSSSGNIYTREAWRRVEGSFWLYKIFFVVAVQKNKRLYKCYSGGFAYGLRIAQRAKR